MNNTSQRSDPGQKKRDSELSLAFVDAAGKPIDNLPVKLEGGGEQLILKTDSLGLLPIINFGEDKNECKVLVTLPTGAIEAVLTVQLGVGLQCITCSSPYLLLDGKTRVHNGPPTINTKSEPTAIGTIANKRSKNGNPVRECTVMDCPNEDNLRLCPNQQYREVIVAASKRSKIIPHAIAALINSEAGRKQATIEKPVLDKKGKPVSGKDGKPKTKKVTITTLEWREDSSNPKSSARGLTQFIESTWLEQALDTSTYLHPEAVNRGYVNVVTTQVIVKKATKNQPAVTKNRDSYAIKKKNELLEMRMEPEYAIMAAIDYGAKNLNGLKTSGFDIDSLVDSEKAKFFYLTHHLGLSDAKKFIRDEIEADDQTITRKNGKIITISGAETLLNTQMDSVKAASLAEAENDNYVFAHRRWLIDFIDRNIDPLAFACDTSKLSAGRTLYDLILTVGGSHPDGF